MKFAENLASVCSTTEHQLLSCFVTKAFGSGERGCRQRVPVVPRGGSRHTEICFTGDGRKKRLEQSGRTHYHTYSGVLSAVQHESRLCCSFSWFISFSFFFLALPHFPSAFVLFYFFHLPVRAILLHYVLQQVLIVEVVELI